MRRGYQIAAQIGLLGALFSFNAPNHISVPLWKNNNGWSIDATLQTSGLSYGNGFAAIRPSLPQFSIRDDGIFEFSELPDPLTSNALGLIINLHIPISIPSNSSPDDGR